MVFLEQIFFFLLVTSTPSLAYPTGAPLEACVAMRPFHPPTTTSGTAPYAISLSIKAYTLGSQITGTVSSTNGSVFRGFLLQARKADNSDSTPLGEFVVTDSNTKTSCGDGNKQALTHVLNTNKTKISFTWNAPSTSQGDIHFKLTVVESYNVSRYWLGTYSAVVIDCSLHPSGDCGDITTEEPFTGSTQTTLSPPSTETTVPPPISTTVPSKNIPFDPECGVTKGCFPACHDGCQYLVTWQPGSANQDYTTVDFSLEMLLQQTTNVWIAIGLSPTGKMDKTNVVACISDGNKVTLESSHNEKYVNTLYDQKTVGLTNMKGSSVNGKISCTFTRQVSMNVSDFISLRQMVYLLVGTGPVDQGVKQQHEKIPTQSANKIDFLKTTVSGEASSSVLIKLHGSLMVFAWILCSSIGLVIARHCKGLMGTKLLCSLKYWFVFHRKLMMTALVCVIVAFVSIFYEVGGFSQISEPSKSYTEAHPYLGIAVTVLTLTNPIMALFRPAPDHKSRPIFNWAHLSVGTIAHIIAVVTIFFGINLSKAQVDDYATYVMYAYTGIYILVHFILEVHRRNDNSGYKGVVYPNTQKRKPRLKSIAKEEIVKLSVVCCLSETMGIAHREKRQNQCEGLGTEDEELVSFKSESTPLIKQVKEETSVLTHLVLFLHVVFMIVIAVLLILMICLPQHFQSQ